MSSSPGSVRTTPDHAVAFRWLASATEVDEPFGLFALVLSATVRLITNGRIFAKPTALEDAFLFCNDLRGNPNVRMVEPGERHWSIFQKLCNEAQIAGPRVTDAWYAALAIEQGGEWITFDRGFSIFITALAVAGLSSATGTAEAAPVPSSPGSRTSG